jgi:hypothetical protein
LRPTPFADEEGLDKCANAGACLYISEQAIHEDVQTMGKNSFGFVDF